MPRKDGYQATRDIRLKYSAEELPIVAMTANAMKGDRERCLEAGMNDYVSKPINLTALKGVLAKWLTADEPEAEAEVSKAS